MPEPSSRRSSALVRHQGHDRGPLREFLAFKLGSESYAVEIGSIGAILRLPPITPVPRAPDEVMGIISVRGKVVAVLDLRRRLRLPISPPTRLSRILLLPSEEYGTVGLFVEQVLQVYRLSKDEIEIASHALGTEISEHVIGIGRPRGALLVLMDPKPILKTLTRAK